MDYSQFKVPGYPVRHRRKVPFDPVIRLGADYMEVLREISNLDAKLGEYVLGAGDYREFVDEAYASNIYWSVKIEGNRLTPDEVRDAVRAYVYDSKRRDPDGDVQEVLNQMESLMCTGCPPLPWNTDAVCMIHRSLMAGTGIPEVGTIRTGEVCVADGTGFEFFIPCPVIHVGTELESLLDWISVSPFDEIITAVLVFHEFESIHPFTDGNGRTGRAMFRFILEQLGLENVGLCRYEQAILQDTGLYYDLLAYTDYSGNYAPLIRYVAEKLLEAYREADESFSLAML